METSLNFIQKKPWYLEHIKKQCESNENCNLVFFVVIQSFQPLAFPTLCQVAA